MFLGATTDEHETNPSLGIEYEYRFSERWGLGAILEFTFEYEEREFFAGVPVKYHLGPLAFLAAVGVERSREEETETGEAEVTTDAVGRLGAEYGFEVGSVELAPNVNVDYSDSNTKLVWGLVVSLGL